MIRSLKAAFGLSLLAALALSAMSVIGASAKDPEANNHFSTSTTNTKYTATVQTGTAHTVTLTMFGGTMSCHNPQYSVHHTSTTKFTSLTVTPVNDTNWNCTDYNDHHATVHFKGCHYEFTAKATSNTHATVHFRCPTGVKAELTLGGSTMKFGAQTPTGGATYKNENNEITANITATGISAECHGGCQFVSPTNTTAVKMEGSATVAGFETTTGAKSTLTAT